ncbi:MAG: LptF/LptG family permease, partial [Gammaproteobacteria bacterium]|nr:LptF/LptG family permease [Gammaproteobacteria bacterium]
GDAEGSVATWRHLTIDPETRQLSTLVESGSVRLEVGTVQLADATRLTLTPEQITQERTAMTFDTGLQASGVRWLILPAEQLSLTELWVAQQFLTAQGLQSRTHAQVFWQRLAAPLTLAVLGLLAAVTAFGTFRGVSGAVTVIARFSRGIGRLGVQISDGYDGATDPLAGLASEHRRATAVGASPRLDSAGITTVTAWVG